MDGALTPETTRRTRAALAEIPARLDRLQVGLPLQALASRDGSPILPPSYLSPAQSPDEFVIHQRGRRRLPVTWSPDMELKRNSSFNSVVRTPPKDTLSRFSPSKLGVELRSTPRKRLMLDEKIDLAEKIYFGDISTPKKSPDMELKRDSSFHSVVRTPSKDTLSRFSPSKLGVTLRSTPRKRLLLDEKIDLAEKIYFSDISTPEKFKFSEPLNKGSPIPIKRIKIEEQLETESKPPLEMILNGLSPTQLITLIKHIVDKYPELDRKIRKELPAPDLRLLKENLDNLKCNIYKNLPTSRLISKTDAPAYSRVSTHLSCFKKYLVKQGKSLVESQHWSLVIEYVLMAWGYVRAMPTWDNQEHNSERKLCFKELTNFCMSALNKGGLGRAELQRLQERLPALAADCDEVDSCLRLVHTQQQDAD